MEERPERIEPSQKMEAEPKRKLRTVIASPSKLRGLRQNLKRHFYGSQEIDVVDTAAISIPQIKTKITKNEPDLLIIDWGEFHPERWKELSGWLYKLRRKRNMPNTPIFMKGPEDLLPEKVDMLFNQGVTVYIPEQMPKELLESAIIDFFETGKIRNSMAKIAPKKED